MQSSIHLGGRNRVCGVPESRSLSSRNRRSSRVKSLLAACRPGWSLPPEFYFDEEIYRLDLEGIWRRGWLFVGHSCEIPEAGSYLTLALDADSMIVIRSNDGVVRAFHNVCRHRGSLICREENGHAARLVCPYHQ